MIYLEPKLVGSFSFSYFLTGRLAMVSEKRVRIWEKDIVLEITHRSSMNIMY